MPYGVEHARHRQSRVIHYEATAASNRVFGLAEGPVWDAAGGRLLWVDVNAGSVFTGRLAGDKVTVDDELRFPGTVGAVVCSAQAELLVAGTKSLWVVARDGTRRTGPQLLPPSTPSRLNDGACDPAGRFLIGSLGLDDSPGSEEFLFRVESGGEIFVIDDDLSLSNGLAWSPDGRLLYSIDTTPAVVWVRPYDPVSGTTGHRTAFLKITDGSPDGMCADSDGNLWIAIWGRAEVRCFSPAGEQLAAISVAAPNVSSVAFVGPGLDALLITTASEQLTPTQRAAYPDSGRLFLCRVGATGAPAAAWSGFRTP